MLSIGKLVAGGADYYLNAVAIGREEYYTGAGEAPGEWLGSGAARLKLEGEVTPAALRALLSGASPVDQRPLSESTHRPTRVAGFDLTFSAPKSVSLLYGLTTDDIGRSVRSAHDVAVADALTYLERHALFVRRGAGGATRLPTSGFVAAAFRHRTSRAGDPQLHTHVLVANSAEGPDSRWTAIDARVLYFHGRTAGFVYQAALRAELGRSVGVRFGEVKNGTAEILGVNSALIGLFSQRRVDIVASLTQRGQDSARAAAIATLDTRPAKPRNERHASVATPNLRSLWRQRAIDHGINPEFLLRVLGRPRPPHLGDARLAMIEDVSLGPTGLTADVSTFERRDIVRSVAEQLHEGVGLFDLERITDRIAASLEVVSLGAIGRGNEEISTTRELLWIEHELLRIAVNARESDSEIASDGSIATALSRRPELSTEQVELVRRLTKSPDGVQIIVGPAGTGKTTALDAVRDAYERDGVAVVGTSLSARAAAELRAGAGITSLTISRLIGALTTGEIRLGRRHVLVVDEAGMVGTRALHNVVTAASGAGTKIVLVGDHRQLPAVGAGGAFAGLLKRLDPVELYENRRQGIEWERVALAELRAGSVRSALDRYNQAGRLHEYPTAFAARVAMVDAWAESFSDHPASWMLAARRSDVRELNALARLVLRDRGKLGPDLCRTTDGTVFATRDIVMFLRNDSTLGIQNGLRGAVVGVDDTSLVVKTNDRHVVIERDYLEGGHLDYAYASTIHKAQGATADRVFVLGTESCYREAGYVAMSRGRDENHLFVVTGGFETGMVETHQRSPERTSELDVYRSLAVSHAKSMALDASEPHESQLSLEF